MAPWLDMAICIPRWYWHLSLVLMFIGGVSATLTMQNFLHSIVVEKES
jgi:hypothetical protein